MDIRAAEEVETRKQCCYSTPFSMEVIRKQLNIIDLDTNVCPAEKRTKRSSNILLCLVRFSAGQSLLLGVIHKPCLQSVN